MLIFEKNNKLNINFDPSKSIEGTPDIQIGENEIKLGDAEITSENVLPTPTNEDVGKAVIVDEHGEYALGEAGGNNPKAFVGYIDNLTDTKIYVYKDADCTQRFSSFAEANDALRSVDSAKLVLKTPRREEVQFFVVGTSIRNDRDESYVNVTFINGAGVAKTGHLF